MHLNVTSINVTSTYSVFYSYDLHLAYLVREKKYIYLISSGKPRVNWKNATVAESSSSLSYTGVGHKEDTYWAALWVDLDTYKHVYLQTYLQWHRQQYGCKSSFQDLFAMIIIIYSLLLWTKFFLSNYLILL